MSKAGFETMLEVFILNTVELIEWSNFNTAIVSIEFKMNRAGKRLIEEQGFYNIGSILSKHIIINTS